MRLPLIAYFTSGKSALGCSSDPEAEALSLKSTSGSHLLPPLLPSLSHMAPYSSQRECSLFLPPNNPKASEPLTVVFLSAELSDNLSRCPPALPVGRGFSSLAPPPAQAQTRACLINVCQLQVCLINVCPVKLKFPVLLWNQFLIHVQSAAARKHHTAI